MVSLKSILVPSITLFLMSGSVFAGDTDGGHSQGLVQLAQKLDRFMIFVKINLSDTYNLSVDKLKLDMEHKCHKEYIKEKDIEEDKMKNKLESAINEIEICEKKEFIGILDNVSTAYANYKSLVDEVYSKAYGTLGGDVAKDFEYECKKRKANALANLLDVWDSFVGVLTNAIGEDKVKDSKKAFDEHVSKATDLRDNVYNKDEDYNTHFKDMIKEVNGATEELNKVIDVMISNIGDYGIVIDSGIISSIKSLISTMTKISNVIIHEVTSLILSAFLIFIVN
ncbi:BmGPI9, BMN1 Family [Babesia microti strain RI]|uniref:BmGPI9, BMN1 Family n=1 Tax=Babesia microti (strain RI) TaxID=1133968 RepID=I7I905_BABMR|nr:BmGPI9, BMN1 Family [Babesia microti strain RI]CCF73998.1 BmGPI9, BMN1 Family [Babesia microti strain RI]|eukprot:XP_012648607.1 BmGPI9, BMN1 Family [Babesia microti strain RI]